MEHINLVYISCRRQCIHLVEFLSETSPYPSKFLEAMEEAYLITRQFPLIVEHQDHYLHFCCYSTWSNLHLPRCHYVPLPPIEWPFPPEYQASHTPNSWMYSFRWSWDLWLHNHISYWPRSSCDWTLHQHSNKDSAISSIFSQSLAL